MEERRLSIDEVFEAARNGKLDEAINQVNHDGTTNMLAFVIIGPNRYEVKGDTLTDC